MNPDQTHPDTPALTPRAAAKLAQVIAGARAVIAAKGFDGASVDDIAREAGISKATMYRYFPDKIALFEAMMAQDCARQTGAAACIPDHGRPIADVLQDFGVMHLTFILSKFAIASFRTTVAESIRFPALARDFHEQRLTKAHGALSSILATAAARGELAIEDTGKAALRFLSLCKLDLFYSQLFGIRDPYTADEITAHVRETVDVFLRIYRSDTN